MSSSVVVNTGSLARDYAMLERNILAHFKLALLLSLLSSALILDARLPSPKMSDTKAPFPLAVVLFIATIATLVAGCWEYASGCKEMNSNQAFLSASQPHLVIMALVAVVILATCIVLFIQDS